MKDVIMTPTKMGSHKDKGKVFFNTPLTPDIDIQARANAKKRLEEEFQQQQDHLQKQIEIISNYNKTIDEHLPIYPALKPTNSILVRLYLREPKVTESGIFVPETSASDKIEIKRRGASGERYTQKLDESPWKWSTKAVIVAVPEFIKDINVGDLVQVPFFPTGAMKKEDESLELTFQHAFIHCDANTTDIPQDCLDPHFGYALVPKHEIKCIL